MAVPFSLAAAYQGPPALTLSRVFLAWRLDVFALLVVLALGGGYLLGVLRLRRQDRQWPMPRTVAFCAGLALYVVVTMSFLGVYSPVLFWVRATQNILTLMIIPLLLSLGAPLSLTLAAASQRVAGRLRRWGRATAARALTFPLIVTVLLIAPLLVLYLSPLYELTLRYALIDEAVRLAILGCGFVYFWTRLRLDPTPREDPHLVSFAISLTDAIVDATLGLVLWFGPLIAAGYYEALARPWGPDLRLDQIIGAGVVWIGGDIAGLPFVITLFTRWMRDDERIARRVDRELDEQRAAQEGEGRPSTTLWWESDPQLAERFKRR